MRATFHDDLGQVIGDLVEVSNLVATAIRHATVALLAADISLADDVICSDDRIDALCRDIEAAGYDLLARQAPVASDLRTVVTALRMITNLERMGDLSRHIAKVARMRYPVVAVPDLVEPTFRRMGEAAERVIEKASRVIANRDGSFAAEFEADDDVMDQLHRELFQTLLAPDWPYGIEAAIDITLLGRYYERFGDHAVSVARRMVYLATGEFPKVLG